MKDAEPIEAYPDGPLPIPGPRRYRVEQAEDEFFHHEYLVDADGQTIYDQAERVDFALGSGQRGRAYLIEKDGLLFQSPLGWYSTESRWDLSPGYHPDSHPRFQRRIGDGCLYCHAGRVAEAGEDRYGSPVFTESAIGCERCHGPGGDHVALHRQENPAGSRHDTIVNPASLEIAQRESVCNQCHLQGEQVIRRYGREFFDFRPGDLLEDVFVVLRGEDRIDAQGRAQVVSQVEQMRSSRCYIGSEAMLGCISCHDPHRRPSPEERVDYFRDRCLNCHQDDGCELPHEAQLAPPALGSCVHCHMPPLETTDVPHTAQTNHRIPRRPDETSPALEDSETGLVFDGAEERLPDWEVARARGIAMMTEAWNHEDPRRAMEARRFLLPRGVPERDVDRIITALKHDLPVLTELGASYLLTGSLEQAEQYWQRVLQLNPQQETALGGLTVLYLHQRNFAASQRMLDRLLEINPHDPQWHAHQARLSWAMSNQQRAVDAAERVLELDPTRVDIRQWLRDAYEQIGEQAASERHAEILEQM